ncbi:MAG: adenine phosphoribosyltransferase, partial [Candidatus Diapherotrites archaeon]|nr:adenine phosphoribosyltransferase [Candidatus Diapherotrites archaeon]
AIPDFPKPGIMFRDVTTLLKDAHGLRNVIEMFRERYANEGIDYVAGIEARGFIIGGAVAKELGVGFIPIRKKGKLPAKVIQEEYKLEYGTDTIEIHEDSIAKGDKILLIDDLLATAGTMKAAINLIEKAGGTVISTACIVELVSLKGREKIKDHDFFCLVQYEDD